MPALDAGLAYLFNSRVGPPSEAARSAVLNTVAVHAQQGFPLTKPTLEFPLARDVSDGILVTQAFKRGLRRNEKAAFSRLPHDQR